jgi:hypothetical protein
MMLLQRLDVIDISAILIYALDRKNEDEVQSWELLLACRRFAV